MTWSDADFKEYADARWSDLYRTAYLFCPDPPIAAHRATVALAQAYVAWSSPGAADDADAHARRSLVGAAASWRTRRRWAQEVGDTDLPPSPMSDTTLPGAAGEDVLDALMGLAPGPRAVLVLRCLHDQGPREIAELLGWRRETVVRHAEEGVRRLQTMLADAQAATNRALEVAPMRRELRDSVRGALAEIPVRPLRLEQVLATGRSRRAQRRRSTLVALAGAAVVVAGVALTWPGSGDPPDSSRPAQVEADVMFWEGLGVPWIDNGRVIYGFASLPRPVGLAGLAATADSVIMTIGRERATIVELRPDGTLAVIGQDVIGVAVADTSGRVAAWTEGLNADSARVVAYDTAAHRVIARARVDRGMRVFALHDRNVVLHDGDGSYLWTAGLREPPATFDPGGEGFTVTDLTYSHTFVASPQRGARLLDRDGNVLEDFPDTGVSGGAFDPTGRFVSGLRPAASTASMSVYDLDNERLVELELSGVEWTRWTPESQLVVRSSPPDRRPTFEESPMLYSVCAPQNGRCTPLEPSASTL